MIAFNAIATPAVLLKEGPSAFMKYKAGDLVTVQHKGGKFSII